MSIPNQNRAFPIKRRKTEDTLVSWDSVTTANGNVGGISLIDSGLIGMNDFITDQVTVIILGGAANLERQLCTAFNPATGEVDFNALSAQIVAGTPYRLTGLMSSNTAVITGDLVVPSQNSADNSLERDVIGNKTDTTAGNSLYALLLQALAALALTATEAEAVLIFNAIAALNNLSQAQILSDSTPFPGADIPAILTDLATGLDFPIAKTFDLNQVAASYNLFTGTTQVVLLKSLLIRISAGTIGGLSALANGTGTVTEAGNIPYGTLTVHITGAGTFTITLPPGVTGTLTSGTATISGSPKTLVPGVNNCTSGVTTGTATLVLAATLTGISIQTDDATPQVIIPTSLGVVTNLTNQAQLSWSEAANGPIYIAVGTHIKITIYGGATGIASVENIVAEYRPVIAGGVLS